jgi:hypothetical protein
MNPEIDKILEEMKARYPERTIADQALDRFLSIHMARLLVLLAEEAEKQGKKIVVLTWAMAAMSVALILLGIIQIMKC